MFLKRPLTGVWLPWSEATVSPGSAPAGRACVALTAAELEVAVDCTHPFPPSACVGAVLQPKSRCG